MKDFEILQTITRWLTLFFYFQFLAEVTMLECDPFLRFLPSVIAASAVALANHTQVSFI